MKFLRSVFVVGLVLSASAAACRAESVGVGYYVSRDANPMVGQNENPNFGRLTLLYNHGNHFHSIGRFGGGPNRLPEGTRAPITLFSGSGDMEGRFVSKRYDDGSPSAEYSDLRFESIRSLSGFDAGTPESILFNSSSRRWVSGPEHPDPARQLSLEGSLVALEVVSLSAGLHASIGDQVASTTGDRLELGAGDTLSSLLSFFTDTGIAPLTNLTATFRLIDLSTSTALGGSGDFRFELQTIPEPGSIALVGVGLLCLIGVRWRRSRRPRLA
jgi:hypothetical protein